MKKFVPIFAIILIAAMVLGACATTAPAPTEAPAEEPAPTEAPAEEPQPTEAPAEAPAEEPASEWEGVTPAKNIVFWHQHTKKREEALKEIVDEFNATNEWGITVEPVLAGSYSEIFNKVNAMLNTPEMPDVFVGYQNQVATYQLADAVFDMNTIIDDPQYGLSADDQADFIPAFFRQDVFPLYDNQRLALAPNRSMEVMYYNMDWLKELGYDAPPATPEEFKEMACKAAQTPFSGKKGDAKSIGYELSIDTSRLASWTFAFGGDIYDAATNQYTLNSPAAVEAMSFIQGLFKDGCASLVTEAYGDQTDFGNGSLLFTVSSSSGLTFYESVVKDGADFEWSVAPLPHTGEPAQNVYGASVSIAKTTPERELAAWLFIKYYTSPDVQAKWAEASQYFPVRTSVAEKMADFFDAHPSYKAAWELLKYGKFEPGVPGYDFVRGNGVDGVNEIMAKIMDDPTVDVQAELDGLNERANQILADQLATIVK